MAKTVPPGAVELENGERFGLNVVPDAFDRRDFPYHPRLGLLREVMGHRDLPACKIMKQEGESCVGHALAAVINIVLAQQPGSERQSAGVSPYMLYRLARRYDEFIGERDEGSSLRGALKGWFHHGVCLHDDFPRLNLDPEPDLDDPDFEKRCRDRPLGAFYRVNPYRLDDMQSAINELHAVVASGVIHAGWVNPVVLEREGERVHVIIRRVDSPTLGGHAFAIIGYNRVGFVVQNSWGDGWGDGGFAMLPYEDWLDSAYDAWVVRPGVPQTPLAGGRVRDAEATGGELATGRGPDLRRLNVHVVNIAAQGTLSGGGSLVSSPRQIERIFVRMKEWHDLWVQQTRDAARHVLLYAPGGVVREGADLEVAQRHVTWWLNNRIYPIYFAWRTGVAETLVSDLDAQLRPEMPRDGVGFDLVEQFDRLVEMTARLRFRWVWNEMKESARAASAAIAPDDARKIRWPPGPSDALDKMTSLPGASLVIHRLTKYATECGPENVHIHVLGHGAGALFVRAMLDRLGESRVTGPGSGARGDASSISRPLRVKSLTLLAPALRIDEFRRDILPHVGRNNRISRFTTFSMSDIRETNDVCGVGASPVYQKSLLYLISRGLERPAVNDLASPGGAFEVPLLGLAKYLDQAHVPTGKSLKEEINDVGGKCIIAPSGGAAVERSDAQTHAAFDDDVATMTTVVMRMRGERTADRVHAYVRNDTPEPSDRDRRHRSPGRAGDSARPQGETASDASQTVATSPPGSSPVTVEAKMPTKQAHAPPSAKGWEVVPEAGDNPESGSSVLDMLLADGWRRPHAMSYRTSQFELPEQ